MGILDVNSLRLNRYYNGPKENKQKKSGSIPEPLFL